MEEPPPTLHPPLMVRQEGTKKYSEKLQLGPDGIHWRPQSKPSYSEKKRKEKIKQLIMKKTPALERY